MADPVIIADRLSKRYRLGVIGRQTLKDEYTYLWHKVLGRNPLEHMGKVGVGQQTDLTRLSQNKNNDFWALKDISFKINRGEVVGIIGRNGSGKSTLLKLLSRITEPTSGEAFIEGRVGSLLEVGTGFHPELTGRENVYMNGAILGMRKREIDEKFDEIMAFSELEKFIDTPVKRYSSGMYVRLAFAVAAHLEPEILLVDEVLAVGDVAFQKKCLGKMGDVAKEGRTILFVSHNMVAVEGLCTRCIVIKNGELDFIGDAQEGVSCYLREMTHGRQSDLATRTENRKGSGTARVVKMLVTGRDRSLMDTVVCGEDVSFCIGYRVVQPLTGAFLRFTIGQHGQAICTFETDSVHFALAGSQGDHEVVCRVARFNLAPGDYMANIGLSDAMGVADHWMGAYTFTVLPGNMQSTGKQVSSQHGVVVFASDWKEEKAR